VLFAVQWVFLSTFFFWYALSFAGVVLMFVFASSRHVCVCLYAICATHLLTIFFFTSRALLHAHVFRLLLLLFLLLRMWGKVRGGGVRSALFSRAYQLAIFPFKNFFFPPAFFFFFFSVSRCMLRVLYGCVWANEGKQHQQRKELSW
jgi:hypothetical protein